MKNVLMTLNDKSKSMLLCNGVYGPRWVNQKAGPAVSEDLFYILVQNEYIRPINRVAKSGDGPWFAITQKGRDAIKELVSFDIKY